jgi:serine/threonine-protein kinase BUR1
MVFPYMDHDLAGLLENERVKLQPSHIKLYMKQLLEGTAYMHQACFLGFLSGDMAHRHSEPYPPSRYESSKSPHLK